jgi:hypothetical protein
VGFVNRPPNVGFIHGISLYDGWPTAKSAGYKTDHKQNQENEKKDFRNSRRRDIDSCKAEDRSNQGNHQKY